MSSNKSNSPPGSDLAEAGGKLRLPAYGEGTNDVLGAFRSQFQNFKSLKEIRYVPKQCEILIIGGGIMGAFAAYWIKRMASHLSVVVVEKDPMSSTFMSVGGVRQQFSLPENIKMSLFGAEFLRNVQENLQCDGEKVDVPFNLDGYLFLASSKSAQLLYENHKIQLAHNAKVRLLDKEQLKETFKWIDPDEIELGSFGYLNEGWVDARKLLLAVRKKAAHLNVNFVNGELLKFEQSEDKMMVSNNPFHVNTALVDTFDGKLVPIRFNTVINAAGPWAADVARLAGMGHNSEGQVPLSVGLPVEPRKRYIYMFYCESGPILNVPLTIDPSGVFFKRHGLSNYYICGRNQSEAEEPTNMDLNHIDNDYFESKIKPILLKRVPAFRNGIKLVNAWSGYYEYNTLDNNLIIGPHPLLDNFYFANGSSGHGLQHSPAIGLALAELIVYNQYKTLDLKRFGFERVMANKPLKEIDVV